MKRDLGFWLRRTLACLVALCGCVALSVLVLQHALDRPWLKRQLQAFARRSAGVEIDYRSARSDLFSHAEIEGLIVRSPTEMRAFAPELVHVDRVAVHWSLRSLLDHRGPFLRQLSVSNVTLSVVEDEHGRTSFDGLTHSAPSPSVPLSQQASKFFGSAPALARLDVDHVTLEWIRTAHGEVFDRTQLSGLAIALALQPTAATTSRATAALGANARPLALQLSHAFAAEEPRTARATLWVTLDADSSQLTAAADLQVIEQTFTARVPAAHGLHADAKLHFEPRAARTEISLAGVRASDGAADAEASLALSDAGALWVERAHGQLDLARLLRWLPEGLLPVSAARAAARWQIESLAVNPELRLSEAGVLAVDADLADVTIRTPTVRLQFGSGALGARLQPSAADGLGGSGWLKLAAAQLAAGPELLSTDELALDFDGTRAADATIDGRVAVHFARIARAPAARAPDGVVAHDGQVELRVQRLQPSIAAPRGALALTSELAALEFRDRGVRAHAEGLHVRARTLLEGRAPDAGEFDVRAAHVSVTQGGRSLVNAPGRIALRAHDVSPDMTQLATSRGALHAELELGALQASLDATKERDAIDYLLHTSATNLTVLRPLLPPALLDAAPWERMVVALRSSGRIEQLSARAPSLRHTTELDVQQPAFERVAAAGLSLKVSSHGTAWQHEAEIDVRAQALAIAGADPSDDHLTLWAKLDRERPALHFQLASEGRAHSRVSGSLAFDGAQHALAYTLDGDLAGLAPLAPFAAKVRQLAPFDLSQLALGVSAHGTLRGVVAAIARDGGVTLEAEPARTALLDGTLALRVSHFRWAKGDAAILAPDFTWHGAVHSVAARRNLESQIEIGTLHLERGKLDIDLNGVRDEASAVILGKLDDPQIELTQRLSVKAVEQALVPEYPLGDLVFALTTEGGIDGVVHIADMKIANGAGGTELAVTGNVDLSEGRRTLSVTAALAQDLSRISSIPERFTGRGKLSVEANVTSPDFARYRVRAAVKGDNVSVKLKRAGIEVQSANGEVPIAVALEIGAHGLLFERSEKRNPYSMLRFADQHPLLTRSGFLSITRLTTPFASIAPLVGNLEIEQNVISLRQFEMGVRGGSITGQCGIDWDGPNSTLELHVRANGVRSSHGEPFDGNIAVAISAAERSIDGRAEIIRIGERHVLDLLDLHDPLHVDPAMNRIRSALDYGYPKGLRLVFDHGFASARLELGGLARFVSIGELRGIPMGPIVDKMLARMLSARDLKEMP